MTDFFIKKNCSDLIYIYILRINLHAKNVSLILKFMLKKFYVKNIYSGINYFDHYVKTKKI